MRLANLLESTSNAGVMCSVLRKMEFLMIPVRQLRRRESKKNKTQTMKTGISGSGGDGMSEFEMGNGKFILMISPNLKG